ncbi:MAG TPA: YjgP/YjgQ family permease [Planctomycetaceae bacterium]|nr:YjgP/YjgQ family permease [Planctomycetaceae bacterium]
MKLLHRYILTELLKVFTILVSALTVLLTFVGAMQQIRESGLGPVQVLQILPWVVPSLLPFTIPATFLLTVCVVYGRMAGDQEVTAAKAAGINVFSILWPSFLLGAVLSVFSFLMTDQVIPLSVRQIQKTITSAMEDIFLERLKAQGQLTGWAHGLEITVMGVENKRLLRPSVRYAPKGREALIVQAREGTVEFNLEQEQVILHLEHVPADIPGRGVVWLEHEDYPFPLPSKMRRTKVRHMSLSTIRKELAEVRQKRVRVQERQAIEAAIVLVTGEFDTFFSPRFRKYDTDLEVSEARDARFRTEIHSRFALAASCLFFVLLGSPFSILQARRQFLTNFLLVFLPILLCYYPVLLLMMNLSKTGTVNPAYAMWTSNLLVLTMAWFVLRRVFRH